MPKAAQTQAIEPRGPLDATVDVPGSKSLTNRVLLIAALARGNTEISGLLESDDTVVMREALSRLGIQIEKKDSAWFVQGSGGEFSLPQAPLYTENSGTTARFLTAAATLAPGPVELEGNARMHERPIIHLVEALRGFGAEIDILGRDGCPPVRVHGGGLPGGQNKIDGRQSSQYTSAILLTAPYAQADLELSFDEGVLVSRPYVDMTLKTMRDFGAEVDWIIRDEQECIRVKANHPYVGRPYTIEPDASSAAYPFCAAAIAGGSVRVSGIPADSQQADLGILELLERMGCRVRRHGDQIEVTGPDKPLRSLGEVDMNALPDAVLAYAVVALFADGPTLIKNIWNLRIKETDRLAALETELRKLGARAEAKHDALLIRPGPLHGAMIDTYDDHRMAMSFALAGLRIPGVVIRDPGCVSKTWPGYFDQFEDL